MVRSRSSDATSSSAEASEAVQRVLSTLIAASRNLKDRRFSKLNEESVGIIEFLMGIEDPKDEIISFVHASVEWFKEVKIRGIKVIEVSDTLGPDGKNRVVVNDPSAPPMWARFYELGTNRSFFCSRDGIKRYDLSEMFVYYPGRSFVGNMM